ncbi:MAG: MFS transporter [Deltaproteobacteria bacterium]|nr:MFS transporter [Deltaproteobacteria bacterium]
MTRGFFEKINYGWWIVLVAFYSCLIFSGCIFFAFSLFVKPLQAEFEWSRSTIMGAFTCLYLALAVTSPFAGKAVDRFGAKSVMALGGAFMAMGFALLFALKSPLHFYLGNIIIGIGGSATGPIPGTAVVSDWFREKRGLAIGIMSMGIGVGGLVLAPLLGGFIIPDLGWRMGYLCISILACTTIPLALLVIKKRGIDTTTIQKAANRGTTEKDGQVAFTNDLNLRDALLSPAFWLITGAIFLSQFAIVGTVQSQVPHLQDIGFPVSTAAAALGGIGLVSAFSKLFFGWVCDLIKSKYAFALGVFFMAVGTFTLMMIDPTSPLFIIWAYSVTMGFGGGSWLPVISMIVSTNFGLASYGAIFGAVALIQNLGVSMGPLFAGYIYDTTNGYHWAFVIFMVLYAIAIPTVLAVKRPKTGRTKF